MSPSTTCFLIGAAGEHLSVLHLLLAHFLQHVQVVEYSITAPTSQRANQLMADMWEDVLISMLDGTQVITAVIFQYTLCVTDEY